MAGTIKGITIEFRGKTTELGNALRKIKGEAGKTKSELSKINKALKFNPGNVEILTQKQMMLREKVKQTTDKVNALKAAQEKMDADGVDKCSKEYRELRREIIVAESQQKSFNKQLQQLRYPKLTALGTQLQELGGKVKAAGSAMTRYITLPLVAIGGASVKVTADFDSAMSKVRAVSGATGKDFEKLRDKAREMGATTKFSATEAAEAMNYMAMAGWKTEEMLSGIAGIMNLAAASGEDLATTSDIVTDALTAFGLSASDSSHFADVLATTSANANTNVALMGESFKTAAPAAAALGFSAEDTSLAIGMMANAGIKGSEAGTALRAGLLRMAKPTAEARAAMEKYGISLTDAQGNMLPFRDIMGQLRTQLSGLAESEQAAALTAIFGKESFSGWAAVVNGSDKDFNKLKGAIDNCDGSAAAMAETMNDNLGGQVTILKSQMQELAISIGEVLVPIAKKLVAVVQKVADWFNGLSETQKKVVVYIGIIVAAIGPLLVVLGTMAIAIGTILTALPGALGVIAGAAAAAGPVIAIIAGIVAGIAAVITIIKHLPGAFQELKEGAIKWWGEMKEDCSAIFSAIHGFITERVRGIIAVWDSLKSIAHVASSTFNAVKHAILTPVQTLKDKIKSIINAIKSFFKFSISAPHIPLPHFSIKPKGWSVGDLLKGKIPSLGINWYKTGGIFDAPSVIGVGEAGSEAVVPLDKLWKNLDGMKEDITQGVMAAMLQLAPMIATSMAQAMEGVSFQVGDVELARAIAAPVSRELGSLEIRAKRKRGKV